MEQLREPFPASGAAGRSAQLVVHDPTGDALPAEALAVLDEHLGWVVALLLMTLVLGTVVAAGLPLVVAI